MIRSAAPTRRTPRRSATRLLRALAGAVSAGGAGDNGWAILKSAREIALMRAAGRVAGRALAAACDACRPGVTTREIDAAVCDAIRHAGGEPLFEGYRQGASPPFPAATCVSVNEEVVHGVPGDRIVRAGDVVSVDVGVRLRGWCADAARTVVVPAGPADAPFTPPAQARGLVEATRAALMDAIGMMAPGVRWSAIAAEIQRHADAGGFGVVREYVGHGVGRRLHEPPRAPAFDFLAADAPEFEDFVLERGMTLAVEPIFTLRRNATVTGASAPAPAGASGVALLCDGWTVATRDRSIACHEEHTIAVTEDGAEVLTGV